MLKSKIKKDNFKTSSIPFEEVRQPNNSVSNCNGCGAKWAAKSESCNRYSVPLLNYYGFVMNNLKLNHFYHKAIKSLYKWLNRRSQKKSYNWESFNERLKYFPLMKPWDKIKLKELGGIYANSK